MTKYFIGIDNGVSGSIAILDKNELLVLFKTPVIKSLDYTKSKRFINRLDANKLDLILSELTGNQVVCYIERPMVNPTRFRATLSALRCLESTLIVLELLKFPYCYIDSKQWQKELLPTNLGKDELKLAAEQVAKRLFPTYMEDFGVKDADGLLIAEFARRKGRLL